MKHLISASQFQNFKQLEHLFNIATMANYSLWPRKVMACLFYEPSTRTRFSFESAMYKLGGSVISEANPHSLSVAKGESLEDTVRTVSQYVDVVVLRHPEADSSERAAKVSKVSVINAGAGIGQHPTQALLDMFTIRLTFPTRKKLSVLLCGDLKHGRTVHSLLRLLSLYSDITVFSSSPRELMIPQELTDELNIKVFDCGRLKEGLMEKPDVVYMTRLQKERSLNGGVKDIKSLDWENYCLTLELMKHLDEEAIVMHPLPRNEEISVEVDNDPRCVYFTKQVKNGMLIRMAILECMFNDSRCWNPI